MLDIIMELMRMGYKFNYNDINLEVKYIGYGEPDPKKINEFLKCIGSHGEEIKSFFNKSQLKRYYNQLLDRFDEIDFNLSNVLDNSLIDELMEAELHEVLNDINLIYAHIGEPLEDMTKGYEI